MVSEARAEAAAELAHPTHALRFPQYTALRPVVVLNSTLPSTPFAERLFVRGLVSSLLANATSASGLLGGSLSGAVQQQQEGNGREGYMGASGALHGAEGEEGEGDLDPQLLGVRAPHFRSLLSRGCGGTDLVWWAPLQPPFAAAGGLPLARWEGALCGGVAWRWW